MRMEIKEMKQEKLEKKKERDFGECVCPKCSPNKREIVTPSHMELFISY